MNAEEEPSYYHHWRKEEWEKSYLQLICDYNLAEADAKKFLESCKGWRENYWNSPNFAKGVELPCKGDPRGRVLGRGLKEQGFSGFEKLPQEVRRKIIEIAILEEIKERVSRYTLWYGLRTWREFGKGEKHWELMDVAWDSMSGGGGVMDVDELWHMRVLRRGEVVRKDCVAIRLL